MNVYVVMRRTDPYPSNIEVLCVLESVADAMAMCDGNDELDYDDWEVTPAKGEIDERA